MLLSTFVFFFSLPISSLSVEDDALQIADNNKIKDAGEPIAKNPSYDLWRTVDRESLQHSLKRRSPTPYIPRSWLRGGGGFSSSSSSCYSCRGIAHQQ